MNRQKGSVNYLRRPQHATRLVYPRRWLRAIGATFLALVLFVTTAGALLYHDLNTSAQTVDVKKIVRKTTQAPKGAYDGMPINILVIGSDTREGEGNKLDLYKDNTARADTTLLVHISADRKRVEAVSIPRDTVVNIPVCDIKGGRKVGPQHAQFNWAFSVTTHDDIQNAIACTWKTVEEFSGVTIDEFVMVDFHGFENMVNALGGVNIFFDKPMKVWRARLDIPQGCHHLDGAEALGFARTREGYGDGSDLSRIKRQQYLLSIMMRTAMSKSLFTDLPSLYQFLREGLKSLTLSPGLSDIKTMAAIAYSLKDIDPKNIEFVTAPVAQDPANHNRVVFTQQARGLWESFANDTPLPAGLVVRDGKGNERVTTDPNAQGDHKDSGTSSPSESQSGEPKEEHKTPEPSKPAVNNGQAGIGQSLGAKDPFAEERAKCEP